MTGPIPWQPDPEFSGADQAERAVVGSFELIAYDLPETRQSPRIIGWEMFTGPDLHDLVDQGNAETFEAAKAAAEAAYHGQGV